jgi:hypothetical protein
LSFPLGGMLPLALLLIGDYTITGEQVSEETTSTERARTNSGLLSRHGECAVRRCPGRQNG